MEPITLGVVVAALVAKAAERGTDRVVDGGESLLRRAVGTLRRRLTEDDEAMGALQLVERAPDSPSGVRALADLLDARLAHDDDLRSEFERVIESARDSGEDVEAITQRVAGVQNIQIGGVHDSQITVSYGSPRPSMPGG